MQLSHSENTYNEELVEKSLWISLSNIHGVGSQTFCQLLKTFGNPANIYAANHKQLKEVVSDKIAAEITKGVDEEALRDSLHWLSQANNHLVTLADSHYPKALLEISDPPPFLYAKGNLALLNIPSIAIVGSRNASVQGEKNAEAFAQGLSGYNLCIVSGLALGIDGAAHRGALKANGATIAVVGTGLDIVYPARHRDLAHQIVERGLIISEFALGTPSKPQNFPKRNRIISGLSLGCLVVEANLQSGSQITARLSAEQGREVFAIPGSIHSPMSKGCHQLIKQGAKLVDCLQDIVEELDLINATENVAETSNYSDNKTPPQNSLLTLMGYEPITLENIVHLSGLTVSEVSSMLMLLELEGGVASLAGGQYQKIM
ncbi:DNA-processing protein DprA [Methylotenera sp.]|uniref:DNA-processing protein DprA n=1 Tax=Methylotenera sp. TaxID=2051956 RepID=UPI00272FDAC4|nr:DNA-processing protein DprA [Methylotenera sp.]MDP2070340.1 DNA-processing protein DprA [Methylotenera sp.]MDP3004555.1 DNA-processing protein DprA [Methylotenera sp.]